jgi:cell division FtsZ-interacting protein ZapD
MFLFQRLADQIVSRLLCHLKLIEERIMADLSKFQAAVDALVAEQAAVSKAVSDEIARVEAVIASLKGAGADQSAIDAATAQLESVVSNLSATQAQADAEQPAV